MRYQFCSVFSALEVSLIRFLHSCVIVVERAAIEQVVDALDIELALTHVVPQAA